MSACFTPEWLALREPADAAARSRAVLEACRAAFRDRPRLRIVDLGAGTGATLRALHNLLPAQQDWVLIDNDPAVLAVAREQLAGGAPDAREEGAALVLSRAGKALRVRLRRHDLARSLPDDLWGAELVTASALFDLASSAWIDGLAASLARRSAALLAMLTFDGTIRCTPGHGQDDAVAAAFARHQKRDKGLGVAAGPDAARHLLHALAARGCRCVEGGSPWRLPRGDALRAEVAAGIAAAVAETGLVAPSDVTDWRAFAEGGAATLTIGHADLFAAPPA